MLDCKPAINMKVVEDKPAGNLYIRNRFKEGAREDYFFSMNDIK